jgi:cell division protein FtsW
MGNGTSVVTNRSARRVVSSREEVLRRLSRSQHAVRLGIDVPLLLIVATLVIFGLLMVYSASADYSQMILKQPPDYMFNRQLLWLGVGLTVAVALTFINYHFWKKIVVPLMALNVLALLMVLFFSPVINNASRTIIGGSGQPSEAAKIMTIIYLSVWLYAKRDRLSNVSFGLIPLGAILGILGGLIFVQPDLSAATTIFMLGGILFFLAGGDLRQIAAVLVMALLFGGFIFNVHPTGKVRVAEYLLSLKDITQAPMHLSRALEALIKGGWFGVGLGHADTKLTGLPVPPTDSIFAVIGEEIGILGAAAIVLLFILLLWRGLSIANRAPDGLGRLLAAGLSLWIAMEAFINMAVIVGLVPFAGNALPFISAGGSNLIVSLAAIGILMNIARLSARNREAEERTFDAVVDLRRWDGRRRVSSPRRAQ